MNSIDNIIDGLNRFSLRLQLKDMLREIDQIDSPECGNCYFWMKRECPREQPSMRGFSMGPSANDLACSKFQIKKSFLELKSKRIAEAATFAKENNLKFEGVK